MDAVLGSCGVHKDHELKVTFNVRASVMIRQFLAAVVFMKTTELSLVVRKPVLGVSDQVRHKQACTATEDG